MRNCRREFRFVIENIQKLNDGRSSRRSHSRKTPTTVIIVITNGVRWCFRIPNNNWTRRPINSGSARTGHVPRLSSSSSSFINSNCEPFAARTRTICRDALRRIRDASRGRKYRGRYYVSGIFVGGELSPGPRVRHADERQTEKSEFRRGRFDGLPPSDSISPFDVKTKR